MKMTTMAEHHRDQELQSTDHVVNIGDVVENHDVGHPCNSSWIVNINSSWVHRQSDHPAMSPVKRTVVNLEGHNNTYKFYSSSPEPPRAADDAHENNRPRQQRCNGFSRKRCAITTLITLVVILVAVAGFVYSVKPNKLKFSVDDISIQGFSDTSTDLALYPPPSLSNYTTSCNITMKVRNPNLLFGIYHEEGSVISVHHRNTELFHGEAPSSFYQKARNETTLKISLKNDNSSSIGILKKIQDSKELGDGMIPLEVSFGARATFKFSSVLIKVVIWAECQLIVNALAVDSDILSQNCPVTVEFGLSSLRYQIQQ